MKVYKYNKHMVGIDHDVYVKLKKLRKGNNWKTFSETIDILIYCYDATPCWSRPQGIYKVEKGGEKNGAK